MGSDTIWNDGVLWKRGAIQLIIYSDKLGETPGESGFFFVARVEIQTAAGSGCHLPELYDPLRVAGSFEVHSRANRMDSRANAEFNLTRQGGGGNDTARGKQENAREHRGASKS
jgi:hypothetical protein